MTSLRRLLWAGALVILTAMTGAKAVAAAPAVERGRETIKLDMGWRFHLGDVSDGANATTFDDSTWDRVSLPHNWNRMGGTAERGADYLAYHGAGWYRLSFDTPADLRKRLAWLQFDAASMITDVWLNGVHLGTHKGAFAAFRFNATPALRRAGPNLLVVRADNSDPHKPNSPTAEVIPMSGDFPIYGGLYRPVSLVLTAPVHVAMTDFGGPGIYASTQGIDETGAHIALIARLESDAPTQQAVTVSATILDADGRIAASARGTQALQPSTRNAWRSLLTVARPHLWDGKADPYLYRFRVELRDSRGNLLDAVEQPLGIRTFRIDTDKGFFLNGRPLPLHGVSRHQDRQGKGWAIDDRDIDEDFALIREIGANTVRLAHYQHAQHAYDDADRDGLAIWAEIPLVDRTAPWGTNETTPAFADNAEQQLRELIRQNYNHPSVIVWSIGNEVNPQAIRDGGKSNARPLLERLQRVVHEEDSTRPATMADCCGAIPAEAEPGIDTLPGITDTIGYNRYMGWYRRDVADLGPELDQIHALYPKQPMSIGEYGFGGGITQHTENPLGGPINIFGRPHAEEMQADMLERTYAQIVERPYLWASWVWNMFDFSNEIRLEGDLTDTNDKGLVTFDRKTRKDAFYFFRANWATEPFVHLTSGRYTDRPYPVVSVKAYSNLPSVRLSVNGKDIGETPCSGGICRWSGVRLNEGQNHVEATAAAAGGTVSDVLTWRLHGAPGVYHIRAGTLAGKMAADGVLWGSDVFFQGGKGHFREMPPQGRGLKGAPPRLVAATADQTAYESWRSDRFGYAIPVPNGRYRVMVHMFEPDETAKPGSRVFDITIAGKVAASGVDIARDAKGAMRALQRRFGAVVTDGILRIDFVPIADDALVSGIEIMPEPSK